MKNIQKLKYEGASLERQTDIFVSIYFNNFNLNDECYKTEKGCDV